MMSNAYKPTRTLNYKVADRAVTDDNIYWKRFETVAVVKEISFVGSLAFSPDEPYQLAAASSTRLSVLDASRGTSVRLLSRFKRAVRSVNYRSDGKLMVAGDDDGKLQLFDTYTSSRSALRTFRAHQTPIHACMFAHSFGADEGSSTSSTSAMSRRVFSFSDDSTVKCWDSSVDSNQPLITFKGVHSDFVRCGAVAYTSSDIVLSGSYDHQCALWDCRTPDTAVCTHNHGAPVEAVAMFPNDNMFVVVGGTTLKVWDVRQTRPLIEIVAAHGKTITSLAFASNFTRILTASLDKHIKVFDTASYSVVHSLNYPAPILSMAISPKDAYLACGMTDGNLLSIAQHKPEKKIRPTRTNQPDQKPEHKNKQSQNKQLVVRTDKQPQLHHHDRLMQKFRHSDALTKLLTSTYFLKNEPGTICSILTQISRRGALHTALAGRQVDTLSPLIRFIARHINTPSMFHILSETTNALIDVCMSPSSRVHTDARVCDLLCELTEQLEQVRRLRHEYTRTAGVVQMLLAHADHNVTNALGASANTVVA